MYKRAHTSMSVLAAPYQTIPAIVVREGAHDPIGHRPLNASYAYSIPIQNGRKPFAPRSCPIISASALRVSYWVVSTAHTPLINTTMAGQFPRTMMTPVDTSSQHREPDANKDETRSFAQRERKDFEDGSEDDLEDRSALDAATTDRAFAHDTRNFLCKRTSNFHLAMALRPGAITIINLAKGRIGRRAASLVGSFLASSFKQAFYAREAIPVAKRSPVYWYCDEFPTYGTHTFVDMPSELRKYKLSLTLACQFAKQLDDDLLDALLENVENLMIFKVGVDTASRVREQFTYNNTAPPISDFTDRKRFNALLKRGSAHEAIRTMPPFPAPGHFDAATKASRRRFRSK